MKVMLQQTIEEKVELSNVGFIMEQVCLCALERCPELTPDVPKVEEKHKSHTKGLFTPSCLRMCAELDSNHGKC